MTHDLLIKNGTIVDGTGAAQFQRRHRRQRRAHHGRGQSRRQRRGSNRRGRAHRRAGVRRSAHALRRADFVDPLLNASSEHGVTTVVMGNCGVGVAPCRPTDHDLLIEDLINVEGMSQSVLAEGIRWNWNRSAITLKWPKDSSPR
jgi:N-acyl-D-aspartate/D-glutamate deacylase